MKFAITEESLGKLFENGDIVAASENISADILSNATDFIDLIEILGFALTSTTIEQRAKATTLLSETLARLPITFFDSTQLEFIATFYIDRLKDHHSVVPGVLTGLLALMQMTNLPQCTCSTLLPVLFFNVPCQSQTWNDREKIYKIFQILTENRATELNTMKADFIYGVINAIDGERDPRLLIFIFEFLPNFLKTFPLYHLAEEMFEVCACYFPIDFYPAPDDPKGITRDSLADKLKYCLCGSNEFADNCIELCVEKMDSQLKIAKLDSLELLALSASTFKPEDIDRHFESIWKSLKIELIPDTNKEIAEIGHKALGNMIKTLSTNETLCTNALWTILSTILLQMDDFSARNFGPACAVALTCSRADRFSAVHITNKLLPLILPQITQDSDNVQQHCTLLEKLTEFVESCVVHNCIEQLDQLFLDDFQQKLIDCLMENEIGNQNLFKIGLPRIVKIISENNRSIIYKRLIAHLETTGTVTDGFRQILIAFARTYPNEISMEITSKLANRDYSNNFCIVDSVFGAFCSLVSISELKDESLTFLLKNATEQTLPLQLKLIAIQNLRKLLEDDLSEYIVVEIVERFSIIDKIVQLTQSQCKVNRNDNLLLEVLLILQQIVKRLNKHRQSEIVTEYIENRKITLPNDLYLIAGILCYIDKDIELHDFGGVIQGLTDISLTSDTAKDVDISNKLICSLTNKLLVNCKIKCEIEQSVDKCKREIEHENERGMETLAWILKGMIVRGNAEGDKIVHMFLDILNNPKMAYKVPRVFEILSQESSNLHIPVVRYLHKQKLFQIVLNILWPMLSECTENHFNVLVNILQSTPQQILKINIEKTGTILFKCFDLHETKSTLSALKIIKEFLKSGSPYFHDHLHHFIPTCLELCKHKQSMAIRIAAIECLETMSQVYPPITLVKYQTDVIYGLAVTLDDAKRLVRSAAAITRNQWYILESSIDGKK